MRRLNRIVHHWRLRLRRLLGRLTGETLSDDLPIGEWVTLDETTRVRRHADGSMEVEAHLTAEHPQGDLRWQ